MMNNLEEILRNKLEGAEINPPTEVFDQIQDTLAQKAANSGARKRNKRLSWVISASVLIPATILTIWLSTREAETDTQPLLSQQSVPELVIPVIQPSEKSNLNTNPPFEESKPSQNQPEKFNKISGINQEVCGKETKLAARFSNSMSIGRWYAESKSVSFISETMENPEEDPNATVVVNEYGVYKLKWIENSSSQSAFNEISIHFKEIPHTYLKEQAEVCGMEIQLNSGGKFGSWSGPDNLAIASPNTAQSTIRTVKAGSYDLVWTENLEGCKASDTITLLFSNIPLAEISLLNQEKCSAMVTVSSPKLADHNYKWDFGSGALTSSADDKYTVQWTEAGKHTISLSVQNQAGCSAEASLEVTIPELPSAFFQTEQIDQAAPALVYFNRQFSSPANPSVIHDYFWDFGDGKFSNQPDPEHVYRLPGRYSVKLTVTDQSGCSASFAGQNIEVKSESIYPKTIYFTPNGDNINDFFDVSDTKLDQFTCLILNQKGEKIVELSKSNPRWDGQLKTGNPATEGLYYYIIRGISQNGYKSEQNGIIYLLRE